MGRTMWTERECQERRVGVVHILSSWAMVGAILAGVGAWTGLRLLIAAAPVPAAPGDAAAGRDGSPLVLGVERTE